MLGLWSANNSRCGCFRVQRLQPRADSGMMSACCSWCKRSQGVEGWYDFHTGAYHSAGAEIVADAPLDRAPLFAPAGAMIPMTRGEDFRRLHDEPSRYLRVFPAKGTSRSSFTLYEDDGISTRHRDGDYAEVQFNLATSFTAITLAARITGSFTLPYRDIRVQFPPSERLPVTLRGEGVALVSTR